MPKDEIILRWIMTDRLSSSQGHSLYALLTPVELLRASRFRFEEDRLTYAAAHALARSILNELTGRAPLSWIFCLGHHGKPGPITHLGEPNICLNLSHAKHLAVVAASIGRELGVDAEWLGRPAALGIAERFFARCEFDLLRSYHESRKQEAFFAPWTLKEAYMKATSRGMNLSLYSFAFGLDPIRLFYSIEDVDWVRWKFHQTRIGQNHIAAIAVDWPEASGKQVSMAPADFGRLAMLAGVT